MPYYDDLKDPIKLEKKSSIVVFILRAFIHSQEIRVLRFCLVCESTRIQFYWILDL